MTGKLDFSGHSSDEYNSEEIFSSASADLVVNEIAELIKLIRPIKVLNP